MRSNIPPLACTTPRPIALSPKGSLFVFGTTSGALAAAAVAKYTKANFTCPACGQVGPANPQPAKIDGLIRMAMAK